MAGCLRATSRHCTASWGSLTWDTPLQQGADTVSSTAPQAMAAGSTESSSLQPRSAGAELRVCSVAHSVAKLGYTLTSLALVPSSSTARLLWGCTLTSWQAATTHQQRRSFWLCAQEPTVKRRTEATTGSAIGSCRIQTVPVPHFSTTTHLTKDSSDFRSTRAAALIVTLKDCLGPLPSSMWACRQATRDEAARSNLRSGTGCTPSGQVTGQWPAACEATAC